MTAIPPISIINQESFRQNVRSKSRSALRW
jgi:hypothetical protein